MSGLAFVFMAMMIGYMAKKMFVIWKHYSNKPLHVRLSLFVFVSVIAFIFNADNYNYCKGYQRGETWPL